MSSHFVETIRSLSIQLTNKELEIQRLSKALEDLQRLSAAGTSTKTNPEKQESKANNPGQPAKPTWSESSQGTWDWHGRKIFVTLPLQRKTIFQLRDEGVQIKQVLNAPVPVPATTTPTTTATTTPIAATTKPHWMANQFSKLQQTRKKGKEENETFEQLPGEDDEEEHDDDGEEEHDDDDGEEHEETKKSPATQEELLVSQMNQSTTSTINDNGDMDTAPPVYTVARGSWNTIQSGGPLNSANPQFTISFPDAGLHRAEIIVSRKRSNKKSGIIFYVFDAGLPGAKDMLGRGSGGRLWFGYPDDAADEVRLSPKYKSKATRGRSTRLKASFRGGGRPYIVVPCMEKMGSIGDFQLKVVAGSTSRGLGDDIQMPVVNKSGDLQCCESRSGLWAGLSASRLQTFADSSNPSVSAPHVCNPQFLMTVNKGKQTKNNTSNFVLVTVTCTKKIAKNATLHVFVYKAPTKSRTNPHCRRLTFPTSALVAHQDGFSSGNNITVAANLGSSREGTFIICCSIQEEEQEDNNNDYEYDTPIREGQFEMHVRSEEDNAIHVSKQLPHSFGTEMNENDNTGTIDCDSILNGLRNNRLPGSQGTGPIDKLDWDFLTLESDPLPKILKKCQSAQSSKRSKFVDQHFRPNERSVNKDPHDTQLKYERWARLSQLCDEERLFRDGIDADDVLQGSLGNCWFMGAIASIAWARPECIRDLFSPACTRKECLETGCFSMKIFSLPTQTWRWVVVDDYIPVDKNFRPVFSRGRDPNEIWVMLIEKCFAKLHGSYQSVRLY